jgi:hypothetical protein
MFKKLNKAEGMVKLTECLANKLEALSSNPTMAKEKNVKKRN